MNREELQKLLEDHASMSKTEMMSLAVGLITTVLAIAKESKAKKDRLFLGVLLALVTAQCFILVFIMKLM